MKLFRPIELGTWETGKYIDRWMFVHLIGGIAIGVVLDPVGVPIIWAALFTIVVMTAWELYEIAKGFEEPTINKVSDVVVSVLGMLIAYESIPSFGLNGDILLTLVLFALWGGMSVWGWVEWHREIEREKARLK